MSTTTDVGPVAADPHAHPHPAAPEGPRAVPSGLIAWAIGFLFVVPCCGWCSRPSTARPTPPRTRRRCPHR